MSYFQKNSIFTNKSEYEDMKSINQVFISEIGTTT